jgi:hypothetical protein
MLHLLVRPSPFYFFSKTNGTHFLFVSCRGNIGEPTRGESFSSTRFKSIFTKGPAIFSSIEASISPGIQLSPTQAEIPVLSGMDPSSPQPKASNRPGTPPASPQLEASALPGTLKLFLS